MSSRDTGRVSNRDPGHNAINAVSSYPPGTARINAPTTRRWNDVLKGTRSNPQAVKETGALQNARHDGYTQLAVNASDNKGVVKVQLYVDNKLTSTSTTAPFTTTWNARRATRGSHALTCKAYDAAGNVGNSPVVTAYK